MMGGWGPKSPEEAHEYQERAMREHHAEIAKRPLQNKIAKLEARIAKQDRIINLLKKHLKTHGDDNLVLDLLEEMMD